MRAIEVTGSVDEQGNLSLQTPIPVIAQGTVRVIILYPEVDASKPDPDDTSVEAIKVSLRTALQQATSGQRLPLARMWDDIEAE